MKFSLSAYISVQRKSFKFHNEVNSNGIGWSRKKKRLCYDKNYYKSFSQNLKNGENSLRKCHRLNIFIQKYKKSTGRISQKGAGRETVLFRLYFLIQFNFRENILCRHSFHPLWTSVSRKIRKIARELSDCNFHNFRNKV